MGIAVFKNFSKKQKGVLHASHKANSNNSGCAASGRPDILRVIAVMGPGEREAVCGRFHCDDNDGDVQFGAYMVLVKILTNCKTSAGAPGLTLLCLGDH